MTNEEYESYRRQQIADGDAWADFAREQMAKLGMLFANNVSYMRQIEEGENAAGVEFKYQKQMERTGNLWIEVKEKARPRSGKYAISGIYRGDNSWLLVTGDYRVIFVFAVRDLRRVAEAARQIENRTKTSVGFLLSAVRARELCLHVVEQQPSGKWMSVARHETDTTNNILRRLDERFIRQPNLPGFKT